MNDCGRAITIDTVGAVSVAEFHVGWEEWLAENLIRGIREEKIVAVMIRNGFPEEFANQKIRETVSSPLFHAARKISRNQRKMLSLFEAFSCFYRRSRYAESFTKLGNLTAANFYRHYYYANRPVAIRGLMKKWKALRLWTPEYFAEQFGECEVEITGDRNADPRYEDNFPRHRTTLQMKEYVKKIREGGETNDFYLVAKNYLLARDEFKALFDHFSCPRGFLDPDSLGGHVKLWFGPKGTVTPLHHDACNILFGQIYGRKRVKLISPFDLNYVYNDRECYSPVDLEQPDYKRFPLMKGVPILDVLLEPGEFLLLPIGWWHWVKSLDISISLSFTNFCGDGSPVVWGYRY